MPSSTVEPAAATTTGPPTMPLFRRHPKVDPADMAALREEITQLRADLDAERAVREQAEASAVDAEEAPDDADAGLPPPEPGTSLDELRSQLGLIAEQLSSSTSESEQVRELATSVGSRLDGLATELANQIDELAGEIEALHLRAVAVSSISPDALEELRAAQVRLANEQARYEIAFRQDLATLADDLRGRRG